MEQPAPEPMLIWDVSIAGSSFTRFARIPDPGKQFFFTISSFFFEYTLRFLFFISYLLFDIFGLILGFSTKSKLVFQSFILLGASFLTLAQARSVVWRPAEGEGPVYSLPLSL